MRPRRRKRLGREWTRPSAAGFSSSLPTRSRRRRRNSFASSSMDTGHPVRDARRLDVPRTLRLLSLFRRDGRQVRGFPAAGLSRLPQLCEPRAGRRGRPDRAVEFPVDVHELEDGAGACGRQYDRHQAVGTDAAVDAEDRRADEASGLSRRGRQRRARLRPHGRGAHRGAPGHQEDRLHRVDGDGPAHRSGVGLEPQEGSTRARRQGTQHRLFRRRHSAPRSTAPPGPSFTTRARPASLDRRLILHEAIADEFLDRFLTLARSIRLGNPLDDDTEMGPLTSETAPGARPALRQGRQSRKAERSSPAAASRIARTSRRDASSSRRSFGRERRDTVSQEEVFGPFVTVTTFADDDEALAIANSVKYGLGSGLWTSNLSRAHKIAREINAGMVWINSYKVVHPGSPFGGVGEVGVRPRNGIRGDARIHPAEVGVGQCRCAERALLPAMSRDVAASDANRGAFLRSRGASGACDFRLGRPRRDRRGTGAARRRTGDDHHDARRGPTSRPSSPGSFWTAWGLSIPGRSRTRQSKSPRLRSPRRPR